MSEALLVTPLFERHKQEGARLVEFAGYSMPVQYSSIIAEAKAVREAAGMFDVSHMARFELVGEKVLDFLEWVTTNDVSKLVDGHGQYSLLPNEKGGVVDDIIVYRRSAPAYAMVVNAANHKKDWDWLQSLNKFGVQMTDVTSDTFMIAVQGPEAAKIVAAEIGDSSVIELMKAFDFIERPLAGVPCFIARSGYTGEDGFEIVGPAEGAEAVWSAFSARGVVSCGLAARDTLRVEAGLPLYGHELSDDMSPIAAGLGWVIGKEKSFLGSPNINAARTEGVPRRLVGVKLAAKRLIPIGSPILVAGKQVGDVSSGVVSVVLDVGIAFGFVDKEVPLESECFIDLRGKLEPAQIVNKRFFKRS